MRELHEKARPSKVRSRSSPKGPWNHGSGITNVALINPKRVGGRDSCSLGEGVRSARAVTPIGEDHTQCEPV